jgi:uncharacterized membrane protein YbhN (UPF0104 family)
VVGPGDEGRSGAVAVDEVPPADGGSPGTVPQPDRKSWRSILFAPSGDGQTRRRGSDAVRLALAALAILVCWLVVAANSKAEDTIAKVLSSAPNGLSWLITTIWWAGTVGAVVLLLVVALVSRRWEIIRDALVAGGAALVVVVAMQWLFGTGAERPTDPSLHGFDLSYPVVRLAVAVAVVLVMLPYLSRWFQRSAKTLLVVISVAAVVHQSGMPVAVIGSLALGWGVAAAVHLVFGSPLGLPSAAEVGVLLADIEIDAVGLAPCDRQEWGVGRFTGRVDGDEVDISVYGRDAADAQLVAKLFRFLLYRDSGPTLTLTRRQQVEHEAYLTLQAERHGARVPEVLAAGPAGPAKDAVLVTRPPPGRLLSSFSPAPHEEALPGSTDRIDPTAPADDGDGDGTGEAPGRVDPEATGAAAATGRAPEEVPPAEEVGNGPVEPPADPVDPAAMESLFTQVATLREARIAHGAISTETVVVGGDGSVGLVDFRAAAIEATPEQLARDVAAALAASAVTVGSARAAEAAGRVLPSGVVAAALPFLQRAALDPVAGRTLKGRKILLGNLRVEGARAAGVEVPPLVEPRRISWVNLLLVVGTLIGGWALIGVLVNVTKSWSTITGADWAWVAVVFVLAQSAYPAIAVTTVGSVTSPLPYGRTLALEVSNTFVALAGGSMAVMATRIRYFQKQGYNATLAVSSGVVVSTASWIVKGALFLIALPIAWSSMHFTDTQSSSGGKGHLAWIILAVVVGVLVLLGLVLMVPRWRRLAGAKVRPKATEVWTHLKLLAVHPVNLVEIFGGNVVAQVVIALALGAALHAFGDHLGLATLLVVLTLASMLGGVSPVPGGMGVVEAGMILGLTAAGIPEDVAVAATFVQRLFTSYLPPIWGWFVLIWLRRKDAL